MDKFETLNDAIKQGDMARIQSMIYSNEWANINALDHYGQTALFAAVIAGNIDVVRLLVSAGSDINIADESSVTSLQLAVTHDFRDIVQFLLENGANVNAYGFNGETALICAALFSTPEILLLLVTTPSA